MLYVKVNLDGKYISCSTGPDLELRAKPVRPSPKRQLARSSVNNIYHVEQVTTVTNKASDEKSAADVDTFDRTSIDLVE